MRGNFTSLVDLCQEIERIEETKNDYLVPSNRLDMITDNAIRVAGEGDFMVNEFAHGQLASKLNIPKNYYDNMAQIKGLRSHNVNAWIKHNESKHLVRTLDGKARAFLSDRYKPIDNFDVMSAFIPVINELPYKIQEGSLSLTEKKLYIPIIFPKLEGEVKRGDVVQYGVILTNSEVGAGAVDIKSMIWRLVCSNGMISNSIMRRHHVGVRLDTDNADIFADDTIRAEIESFKLRFRDVLKHALKPENFNNYLLKLQGAVDDKITKPSETVANVTKRFGLSEKLNDMILNNMAEEGNMNRYGLANGLTALAHSMENRDAQYEVEKMGAKVIEMSRTEWGSYVAA